MPALARKHRQCAPYKARSNHPCNGRMWLGEKRLKPAADDGLCLGRIVEMAAAWNGDCFQVGRVRRDAEGTPGDDFIVIGLYHAYRCAQLSKFPVALQNQRKQPPIGLTQESISNGFRISTLFASLIARRESLAASFARMALKHVAKYSKLIRIFSGQASRSMPSKETP